MPEQEVTKWRASDILRLKEDVNGEIKREEGRVFIIFELEDKNES